MARSYDAASAEIKARLQLRAPGCYSLIGRPEIFLVEVLVGELSQFGGKVIVQKHTDGTTRVVGAAGAAVGSFTGGGALHVQWNQTRLGSVVTWYPTDGTRGQSYVRGYELGTAVDSDLAPAGTSSGTYAPKFVAANVVETLELGWVCVCESGLIWEGAFTVGDGTRFYNNETSLTVAIATRAPVKLQKSGIDFTAHKAAYIAGVDPEILDEVTQAWDEGIAAIPAVVNVSEPVAVLMSTSGIEIGSPSRQKMLGAADAAATSTYAGLTSTKFLLPEYVVGNLTAHGNPITAAPTSMNAVQRSIGAKVGELIIPRLKVLVSWGAVGTELPAAIGYMIDPVETSDVSGWPNTFGENAASAILGPCVPPVYAADGWVTPSAGNVPVSDLMNSRHPLPALIADEITETAPDGVDFLGDAQRTQLSVASKLWATSHTWGFSSEQFFEGVVDAIDDRAEDLIRARKSEFL